MGEQEPNRQQLFWFGKMRENVQIHIHTMKVFAVRFPSSLVSMFALHLGSGFDFCLVPACSVLHVLWGFHPGILVSSLVLRYVLWAD